MTGADGPTEDFAAAFDAHYEWQIEVGLDDETVFVVDPAELGEPAVATCPERPLWQDR